MRVLYFSQGYGPHDHRFLSALASTEHDVYYLRLESNPRQTEDRPVPSQIQQVQWAGGKTPFRWRDIPRLTLDLRRVIQQTKPDLIHAGPVQSCAFLSAVSGFRPLLTMSWGFDLMEDAERNRWWRAITRYTLKRSTFFVSDAQVTRAKAVGYGMNADRTVVFPWGVDLEHFCPADASADQQRPQERKIRSEAKSSKLREADHPPFTLFCNRSWEPRYGVDVLARAFVGVARERGDVRLLLLGGGSLAQRIRQILIKGDALERVQLAGHVSQTDLPRWYRMAQLYVSPSHIDGSSVSLMEALACGLPALVSDIPANREWVTENVNGWLYRDGDVNALADKIMAAMDQRHKLADICRAARATAEKRADWPKNFAALLQAYQLSVRAHGQRRTT